MATKTTKKSAAKTTRPTTVADYIAAAPKEKRAALVKLRATVKAAAPKATESVRYGIVGFMQDGEPVLHFGHWKSHYALYGGFEAHATELQSYDQSGKGTVRFPADKPLPYPLVTKIVKTRIAQIRKAG